MSLRRCWGSKVGPSPPNPFALQRRDTPGALSTGALLSTFKPFWDTRLDTYMWQWSLSIGPPSRTQCGAFAEALDQLVWKIASTLLPQQHHPPGTTRTFLCREPGAHVGCGRPGTLVHAPGGGDSCSQIGSSHHWLQHGEPAGAGTHSGTQDWSGWQSFYEAAELCLSVPKTPPLSLALCVSASQNESGYMVATWRDPPFLWCLKRLAWHLASTRWSNTSVWCFRRLALPWLALMTKGYTFIASMGTLWGSVAPKWWAQVAFPSSSSNFWDVGRLRRCNATFRQAICLWYRVCRLNFLVAALQSCWRTLVCRPRGKGPCTTAFSNTGSRCQHTSSWTATSQAFWTVGTADTGHQRLEVGHCSPGRELCDPPSIHHCSQGLVKTSLHLLLGDRGSPLGSGRHAPPST